MPNIQTYERNYPHHESNQANYRFGSFYLVRGEEDFPNIAISGCNFHWGQALWRKVQELGLAVAYHTSRPINQYIKLPFALPFLPQGHIIPSFTEIAASGSSDFKTLLDYMNRTWKCGTM